MILPEEVHVVQKVCFVKKVKDKIQITFLTVYIFGKVAM